MKKISSQSIPWNRYHSTLMLLVLFLGLHHSQIIAAENNISYGRNDAIFPNPERGFYFANEPPWTAPNPPGEAYALTDQQCLNARSLGYSMIQQWYCLWNYRTSDMISATGVEQPVLATIRSDFATARRNGIKLVITFSYAYAYGEYEGQSDTSAYWIMRHLDQLKPALRDNADVLAFMHNGFIGKWGEWHHSSNGNLDGDNWKPILDKILEVLPNDRMYAVRYSLFKQNFFNQTTPLTNETAYYSNNPNNVTRVGHSDMAFLANADDWATYHGDIEAVKNYVAQESLFSVSCGETTGSGPGAPTPALWEVPSTVLAEFNRMHFATFNVSGASDGGSVIRKWVDLGILPEINRRLGYRWRLVNGSFPEQAQAGSQLSFTLNIHNDGWSNAYNPRPVEVILRARSGGLTRAIRTAVDPRRWTPGVDSQVAINVAVPSDLTAGDYEIDLSFPDPNDALRNRPEYSVRLANNDSTTAGSAFSWRSEAGTNWLGHTVRITTSAPPEPNIGTGTGLTGTYFSDMNFANAMMTRTDTTVDFDWGTGLPASGVGADGFSVRWAGQVQAQFSETYSVTTLSDDGVRLWVNGQLLVNNWTDHGPTENTGTIALVAGLKYDLKMEFYENGGGAVAKLSWASPSTAKQIIPTTQLFPSTPGALPGGWTAQDIGSVALGGSTTHSNGTWTISGSGADIWNSADGFRFANQRVTGDVQVTAQVIGLTNTDVWAKAGVMFRESLAAGSRHASTFATSASGLAYQRRLATDGATSHTAGPSTPAPYWVRIERVGNIIISSTSPNGTTWTEIRRETIVMSAAIYVGLAVTSHNNGALCTATFTNVQVVGVAAAAN